MIWLSVALAAAIFINVLTALAIINAETEIKELREDITLLDEQWQRRWE